MPVQLMTVSEYARHRGCDEKAVRKALEQERITRAAQGRQCIDPAVADIQWAQNTRARADSGRQAGAPPAPAPAPQAGLLDAPDGAAAPVPGGTGYNDHRTRREKAEADMAELQAQQLAGSLVRRDQVERAVVELFRVLRDSLLNANTATALRLQGVTDRREVKLVLDDGYREAFEQAERRIAEWLQQGGAPR